MTLERTKLGRESWLDYDDDWLPEDERKPLFDTLVEALSWEARPIKVFGKEVMQPRLIAWGGALPYRYSGQVLEPVPLIEPLAELTDRVAELTGVPYNHVLLNRYRNGADYMGMHADDEPELGECPTIAALSLGVTRKFVLAHKKRRKWKKHLKLTDGSLLVMGGECQHKWYHGVPKQRPVTEERINVTFRHLLRPPRTKRTISIDAD